MSGRTGRGGFHHATHNGVQLKTEELFLEFSILYFGQLTTCNQNLRKQNGMCVCVVGGGTRLLYLFPITTSKSGKNGISKMPPQLADLKRWRVGGRGGRGGGCHMRITCWVWKTLGSDPKLWMKISGESLSMSIIKSSFVNDSNMTNVTVLSPN